MKYYKVRNWEDYQDRKSDLRSGRRKLHWIKLYKNLIHSTDWIASNDSQKAQLVAILLCCDDQGYIETDASIVRVKSQLRRGPDWEHFLNTGFLIESSYYNPSLDAQWSLQRREEKRREEKRGEASTGSDKREASYMSFEEKKLKALEQKKILEGLVDKMKTI